VPVPPSNSHRRWPATAARAAARYCSGASPNYGEACPASYPANSPAPPGTPPPHTRDHASSEWGSPRRRREPCSGSLSLGTARPRAPTPYTRPLAPPRYLSEDTEPGKAWLTVGLFLPAPWRVEEHGRRRQAAAVSAWEWLKRMRGVVVRLLVQGIRRETT